MKVSIGKYLAKSNNRKVKIETQDYDIWNLDSTLAHIIVPCLVKIKEKKHGAPSDLDRKDLPEFKGVYEYDYWQFHLDEMIWAFTEIRDDYLNQPEVTYTGFKSLYEYHEYYKRIDRATMLFGKHFRNLWL